MFVVCRSGSLPVSINISGLRYAQNRQNQNKQQCKIFVLLCWNMVLLCLCHDDAHVFYISDVINKLQRELTSQITSTTKNARLHTVPYKHVNFILGNNPTQAWPIPLLFILSRRVPFHYYSFNPGVTHFITLLRSTHAWFIPLLFIQPKHDPFHYSLFLHGNMLREADWSRKIHVQIMRFTCCLNMAFTWKSLNWALIYMCDVTAKCCGREWSFHRWFRSRKRCTHKYDVVST